MDYFPKRLGLKLKDIFEPPTQLDSILRFFHTWTLKIKNYLAPCGKFHDLAGQNG